MSKIAPMTNLVNYKIEEDCILSHDVQVFFYRILPPNLSIMTDKEKKIEILKMQGLLDTLDAPLQILGIDKTENLDANKEYYQSLSDEYAPYRNAIVDKIASIEISQSSSIQRAYYLVIKPYSPEKRKQFEVALENQLIRYYPVTKAERVTVMRNFMLREFSSMDIYLFEKETEERYDTLKRKSGNAKTYLDDELTKRLTPQGMGFHVRNGFQNGFLRKTIMIKNFPASLTAHCYLAELSKIKNTTFSMHLSQLTSSLANAIDRQVNNERSNPLKRKKISELINSEMNQSSMEKFYRASQEQKTKAYNVNIFIEMYGESESELKDIFSIVRSTLGAQHISFEELTYEQQEGYLSVSPLGADKFKSSANNMPTSTLASLHPYSHSSRNDSHGLLLGETVDGGYMFVDPFDRTEDITNGNFTIIGIPGQGKSWLMKKILSQLIFMGVSCFVVDPEAEYPTLFRKLGGTVIDCADGQIKINPLEVRRLRLEVDEYVEKEYPIDAFAHAKMFYQHLSWLKDFFKVLYPESKEIQIKSLMILVQELYRQMDIDENTNFSALKHADYPTFTNLYQYIDQTLVQYDTAPHKMIGKETVRELLLIMKDSYDGSLGFVFNGETNIPNSKNICFDIHDLLEGSEDRMQAVIFNIMTYMWSRISLKEGKMCLAFDELSLLMNRKNYTIASYLKNFTKRVRKYDAIIGTATQNINDYLDKEIYHLSAPIFNNTSFKFVFYPDTVEQDQVQKLLKLTDGEMNRITMSKQKHCLLKAGGQSYYMRVGELPYEKVLFGKGGGS